MKTQELNQHEMQTVNGGALLGGLLGGDDSMIKLVSQGYINVSHTDEDGDTESYNLSYGTASLFESESE